jgi:hypothetical protein
MTIVEFYMEVSGLLQLYRSGMDHDEALRELRSLNAEAANAGIEAQVSEDILRNVHIFDDENSYEEDAYDEDGHSHDEEDSSSYDED